MKELNGLDHDSLPTAMQIRLKRHFIRVEVIRKESDQRLRYHMFKRLNTGGETLSEQEVRNCTVRMLENGGVLMKFLVELSVEQDFRTCIQYLSEDARQMRFDQELVLRFFAFKNNRDGYVHDVTDFMTEYAEGVADPAAKVEFDYGAEKTVFLKTFSLLARTLDDRAFGWANKTGSIVKGFSVYHFEALTLGIQRILPGVREGDQSTVDKLRTELEAIKTDSAFIEITSGGGKNSKGALTKRVGFVEERLKKMV